MKAIFLVVLLSAAAFGCAHVQAKPTADNPPLDVPEPPPREVEPAESGAPPPVALPQEPARNTPSRTRTSPPPQTRPEPSRTEPPKPDTPAPTPAEPPKPPAAEEPARPPTTLTTPAENDADLERGIRNTLDRANNDLNRVDYRTLNADAKAQYDYAKRFIRQAEDAIRAKNLVFAKTVADKAAVLATQLAGR
jgi:outer membrane biosynthesis protein TonB